MSSNLIGSLVYTREDQTRWLAEEVFKHAYRANLPIVILGKSYKPESDLATGQWVTLFNDDAVMTTPGWDAMIYDLPASVLVVDMPSQHTAQGLVCFPVVRRWAVEQVGGFSLHTPHTDTYWQDVGRATGTIQQIPVFVNHERSDLTGKNNDQTRAEVIAGYRTHEYVSEPIQVKVRADIEKLRSTLGGIQ